jgi:hypothetical protein
VYLFSELTRFLLLSFDHSEDSRTVTTTIHLRRRHATISMDGKKYQCSGKMWKPTKALVI